MQNKHPNAPSVITEDGKPEPRSYEYDGNGNPTHYLEFNSFRKMTWDEENRLMGINDNGRMHLYTYDHTGERVLKSSGDTQNVSINGAQAASINHFDNYTGYISPYFVISKGKFTKHYFEGAGRITSKIGQGTFAQPTKITAGGINYGQLSAEQQQWLDDYVRTLGLPPGPPTQQGIYASPAVTGQPYPSPPKQNTNQNQEPPEGWPRQPVFNAPGDVPGPPVQFGNPIKPADVTAGDGFVGNGLFEKDIFYYHSDHLGSTSYISSLNGQLSQHVEYIAFGEVLFEEHSSSATMPYLFNGKELDRETNLSYFGARYLDMKTSLWLNVDPLAEKFPNVGGYVYCNNNPLNLIDPDGRGPLDWFKSESGRVVWFDSKAKRLTDTGGGKWQNIGSNLNQVKQNLNIPTGVQTTNWKTITTTAFDGENGSGKMGVAVAPVVFNNSAQVTYGLNIKNTGENGALISGKTEINGISVNARVSSETFAPGTRIEGVSGYFGIKEWTPSGYNFTSKSTPFQDFKGPMLSNAPFHATSDAIMNISLVGYKNLTNTSSGQATGLNLSYKTYANTVNQGTGDEEQFRTGN